jgi:quinol monooxygenase YgiN
MKNLFLGIIGILALVSCTGGSKNAVSDNLCGYNKDSMIVVMRFERKIKPEKVAFFKQSFDACRAEVLAKEPGCLDYSLFQSYHDSTMFCLTEAWATKGAHNAHMEMEHTKKHIAEIQGIADPDFKSKTNYTYWVCPGANEKNK